jgi:hypothetical protein
VSRQSQGRIPLWQLRERREAAFFMDVYDPRFPHVLEHEHVGTGVQLWRAVLRVQVDCRVACRLGCTPRELPKCATRRVGAIPHNVARPGSGRSRTGATHLQIGRSE